ncbi:MAG: universal stress protein [Nitrospirae bacterium]|nr:MAG: universal stress protein [Nitrospirota bacterium]
MRMKILLAVDGSIDMQATIALLRMMRFPSGSVVYLLHVVHLEEERAMEEPEPPSPHPAADLPEKGSPSEKESLWQQALQQQGKAFLAHVMRELKRLNIETRPVLRVGIPGAEILRMIDECQIDLVMVGTRKHSKLERFWLGSVSEWILNEAGCSVLLVRSKRRRRRGAPFHVLLAVDGSPDAWAAVEFTKSLVFPQRSRVTILHVIKKWLHQTSHGLSTWDVAGEEFSRQAERAFGLRGKHAHELLNRTLHAFGDGEQTVEMSLILGHEAEEIVKAAKLLLPDLVVVGSKGLTGLRRILLGSVSSRVARHAPCSVLVVRRRAS